MKLPPITMEGKNTFGCVVNGKIWLPEGGFNLPPTYASWTQNFTTFNAVRDESNFYFFIRNPIVVSKPYSLSDTSLVKAYYQVHQQKGVCTYEDYQISQGSMVISKFDLSKSVLSGTFEFTVYNPDCGEVVEVTDGRFDIGDITW